MRYPDGGGLIGQDLGTRPVFAPPMADTVADLDELAAEGPDLLAIVYRLATGLFQDFGVVEAPQITADGRVRRRYWSNQAQAVVQRWAANHGVEVTDETLR
ncbi:hypothetical protein [Dactylosporangium sp. CA-139066]|uniref:hypothetical protein n=1 Tax=Dactylosporangium sp. CA-139066 TaxID=3239930 RepID=UPI003D8C59E0